MTTLHALASLAAVVAERYSGTELGSAGTSVLTGVREPLRLAVAGRVKAGKSTLLNAIVGEPLAPTDAGECTRVVTWYRHGLSRGARVERVDGSTDRVPFERTEDAIVIELADAATDVSRLEITWPSSRLEGVTLIDTPGVGSIDHRVGQQAALLVAEDDPERAVDAVIYLTNQVHPDDWRFLEAFTDDAGVSPDPSCAVALLSRADEVAGGGPDALVHAAAAAARAAADPAVRRSCQTVLPVSALLAAGAVRLSADQHRHLAALARDPAIGELLATASRFARDDPSVRLLDQLGLFGVRLAIDVLRRDPATSSTALAAELRAASGLDALLVVVEREFLRRRDALRARTSLRSLWVVARRAGAEDVLAELERIEAADHDLAELRLLADWRAGRLGLRSRDGEELERWLDPTLSTAVERDELVAAVERWRVLAEHPLTTPADAVAASIVARSVERRLALSGAG